MKRDKYDIKKNIQFKIESYKDNYKRVCEIENVVEKIEECQAKLNKMHEINLNSYLVNKHFTMVNIFEYLILYKAI